MPNDRQANKEEVVRLIRELKGESIDDIALSTDFIADLAMTSFQIIELLTCIEKRFHIKFGDLPEDFECLQSFGEFLNWIHNRAGSALDGQG